MEARTPALVAQSLNHWTTRQVPTLLLLNSSLQGLTCPSLVVLFPAPPWLSWFWGFCWLNYLIYVLILLFLVQILIGYLTKYALCVCVFSRSVESDLCLTLCNSTDMLLCPWDFSQQEYWSGLPFPLPGNLSNPGIKPLSPASPELAGRFLTNKPPGNPKYALKKQ